MEFIAVLLLVLAVYLLVMPAVASGRASKALQEVERLRQELQILKAQMDRRPAAEVTDEEPQPVAVRTSLPPARTGTPPPLPPRRPALVEAKLPPPVPHLASPAAPASVPEPPPSPPPPHPSPPKEPAPDFTLEQFMGVKLFAWLGGLALFIGIVLFVKYAFEHDLISPEARTAIGGGIGLALCLTGLRLRSSERFLVLSHTLCATGVLILYGICYAGHAFYNLYSQFVAFGMVATVTVAAFLIAVRLEAQVVSVLGMLGGFLSPLILYTGQDRPLGLFAYVALLDIGVLAVVHYRKWHTHTALAAAGTAITMLVWILKFWEKTGYGEGTATLVPVAVFTFFPALFCAAGWWQTRRTARSFETLTAAALMAWLTLVLCFAGGAVPSIADRPWLLFGFVFGQYLLTGAAAWRETRLLPLCTAAGSLVFCLLALWSGRALTSGLLPHALALYLIFGLLQAGIPVLWSRRLQDEPLPPATLWMPLLVLVLMLIGIIRVPASAAGIWLAVLAVNGSMLALGKLSRQTAPVMAAFGLTMLALYAWLMAILRDPVLAAELRGSFLFVLSALALLLTASGMWLRKQVPDEDGETTFAPRNIVVLLPAVLPFPLLLIAASSLPQVPFSSMAAVMLGLAALVMFVAGKLKQWPLFPLTLAAVFFVELALHNKAWDVTGSGRIAWYAAAWALFLTFPFLRRRDTNENVWPWITAALSGVVQFILLRDTVEKTWPLLEPGILPGLCALPSAAALWLVHRDRTTDPPIRLSQLAWFGGVTLLFITLIVPLQWQRQWLTLGWALEGAALCWLYRRVPHEGLRLTGVLLLFTAFARLVLNQAAFTYYPRTDPVWNWQLYTYGLAILAHIAAVRFLDPPRDRLHELPLRSLLQAQAGVLLFVLLNVEIADFFTPSGSPYIEWAFQGNFARDMTFTIAWALYSLGLIAWGLWRRHRGVRTAGVGLFGLTLAKLFLFDLASIGSLYRIAVTLIVAVVALVVSFLYQRFAARLGNRPATRPPDDSAI